MNFLSIARMLQMVCAFLLILITLVQSNGKGLYSGVGSSIGFYRSRRGLEKAVFILTIALGILISTNSIAITLLS